MQRALALLALATSASADTPLERPQAIDVDRADTPPGRTELGFDGGAPVDGFGLTLATTWLEAPIELGGIRPVRRRETVMLGGAVALGSITVDAQIAVAHQVGERLGDGTDLDRWVATDPRLGARIHVTGNATRAVFVRADLGLPVGDDGDFAGDASWTLAWRLIGRITIGRVTVAATAGIRLRGAEVIVGDRLVGDEGLFGAGVIVPLPAVRPLWCEDGMKLTGEVVGILGNDVGMGQGPSPIEARVGVVARPTNAVTVGVRAGRGVSEAIGSPSLRVTLELTYQR